MLPLIYSVVIASALAVPPDAQGIVDAALADAAKQSTAQARVLEVERVRWGNASLGCPQKGMAYTEAVVPGWRIVIDAGGRTIEYHSSLKGPPHMCPPERVRRPLPPDLRT